ncbi:hypothetical protein SASPL_147188 [Salvia splendens]|uniref:Retroviral polymerase SH3-like domain-containing protein n=1 Tax=Salvia splendens TaxID=180675 RepID=A0A8X8WEQ6_SALSN|nr:hypothetical protein SASPL_147188 [Salvia splendens]
MDTCKEPLKRVVGSNNLVSEFCSESITFVARTKLDPKVKRCIFVGYDTHRKGWRCMDPETKKVVINRDVVFDEISSNQIDANNRSVTTDLLHILDDAASSDRGSVATSPEENLQQYETTEAGTRRSDRQRRPPAHSADYEVEKTSLSCMMVLLYVDNMIITGNDDAEIIRLQEALSVRFDMKRFKDEGKLLADGTLFRQLVSSFFYLYITRHGIFFSVGVISQFMGKPRKPYLIAAKRILRYIKNTMHFRLH